MPEFCEECMEYVGPNGTLPRVVVLGNSHTRYFHGQGWANGEQIVMLDDMVLEVTQLGNTGATIWGLENPDSLTQAGNSFKEIVSRKKPIDHLVVYLGDVDVREHLPERCQGRDPTNRVREVLDRYDGFIRHNAAGHVSEKIILPGIVPFRSQFYDLKCREGEWNSSLMHIRSVFNRLLEERCDERGWHYLPVDEPFSKPDGTLKDEFIYASDTGHPSEGEIHLHYEKVQPIFIDKLRKVIFDGQTEAL